MTDFKPKIELEYFDIVGGKASFEAQCGARIPTGASYSSTAHEKAAKVMETLLRLTADLQKLEIDSCQGMINPKIEVKRSEDTRLKLEEEVSLHRADLCENLLSKNTAQAGIITWLKPNVSLVVKPEVIHLKETLKFLMDHEDYLSTGYELYDFIGDNVDIQYDKVMKILNNSNALDESSAVPTKWYE